MNIFVLGSLLLAPVTQAPTFHLINSGTRPITIVAQSKSVTLAPGATADRVLFATPSARQRYVVTLRSGKVEVGALKIGGQSLLNAGARGVRIQVQDRDVLVAFGSRRQRVRLLK